MGRAEITRAGAIPSAAAVALLSVSVLAPAPTSAAEEHPPQVLPGDAHAALVADLDADGANELVRIVATRARGHTVEAWRHEGGAWRPYRSETIPGLEASSLRADTVRRNASSALLSWRVAGQSRVVVLARSAANATEPGPHPCCVDAFELVAKPGWLELVPLVMEGDVADWFQAGDLDGDGTDELIRVTTTPQGDEGTLDVLRWDGAAFRQLFSLPSMEAVWGMIVGQTDGVAGADLIIGPAPEGDLQRIAWVDGELVVDAAHLDLGERLEGGSIAAVVDGALVLSMPDSLRVLRWSRGAAPITTARQDGLVYPYPGIVGSGATTLLAIQEAYFGPGIPSTPVVLYDLGLERVGTVQPNATATALSELVSTQMAPSREPARYPYPFIGSWPGARPTDPARLVWSGTLIEAGADGGFRTQPISPLAGVHPLGHAGPDDEWVALGGDYLWSGSAAYLWPAGDVPEGFGSTVMARAGSLIGTRGAGATVSLVDAVVVAERAAGPELMAPSDGFGVAVTAPPGSLVTAWNRSQVQQLTVTDSSITVTFDAPRRPDDENALLRTSLLVITPDGRVDTFEWTGTFIREPPELSMTATTDAFELSSTIAGVAGPHVSVTVDGRLVPVASDGSFSTRVDARPWPHAVVVTARDPLGNETLRRIEVVGIYDYRWLPWVPILAAATVGFGVALFVRSPRRRMQDAAQLTGDGRLEELDPLEGISLDRR
jgi:hypothetical protein